MGMHISRTLAVTGLLITFLVADRTLSWASNAQGMVAPPADEAATQAAPHPTLSPPTVPEGAPLTSAAITVVLSVILPLALSLVGSVVATFFFLRADRQYRERSEREKLERDAWNRLGVPVVDAADDFVGRLWDIIRGPRTVDFSKPVPRGGFEPFRPPYELSTAWKLVRFLAACAQLQREAAAISLSPRLAHLRFYALDRARWALKGSAFAKSFGLTTEGQQWIGTKLLSASPHASFGEVDYFGFVNTIRTDDELHQAVSLCGLFLNYQVDTEQLPTQFRCVALLGVYLIDLVHDLRPTEKWTEFRVLLVNILREHNRRKERAVRWYPSADLTTEDYLKTFNPQSEERRKTFPQEVQRSTPASRGIDSRGVERRYGATTKRFEYGASPAETLRALRELFVP